MHAGVGVVRMVLQAAGPVRSNVLVVLTVVLVVIRDFLSILVHSSPSDLKFSVVSGCELWRCVGPVV